MIHPIARILQQSRHVRHGRAIRVPVERRLTLENRSVRQGAREDGLSLIRHVADGQVPVSNRDRRFRVSKVDICASHRAGCDKNGKGLTGQDYTHQGQ